MIGVWLAVLLNFGVATLPSKEQTDVPVDR